MKISARNQLKGVVSSVSEGAVNGIVAIDLGEDAVKASITMEAIEDLGIKEGVTAYAVIKATSVMFAAGSERIAGISARNQLAGTVESVKKGAVNGHVALKLSDGSVIKGSITNDAIDELGLTEGAAALAIVKSTDADRGRRVSEPSRKAMFHRRSLRTADVRNDLFVSRPIAPMLDKDFPCRVSFVIFNL